MVSVPATLEGVAMEDEVVQSAAGDKAALVMLESKWGWRGAGFFDFLARPGVRANEIVYSVSHLIAW